MNMSSHVDLSGFSGKIAAKGIFTVMVALFLIVLCIIILYPSAFWRKIVNPWREQGHIFCSDRYSICVSDEPLWGVNIPPRDFFHQALPVISFMVLHFNPKNTAPAIEAMVIISPPENLNAGKYEVINPMDYLLIVQQKNLASYKEFRVLEPPANGTMNGRQVAFTRATFSIPDAGDFDMKMFAFVDKGKAYSLLYRTPKGKFDQYQAEAMKIIESFRFGSDLKV